MITNMLHVGLTITDMTRSIHFYRDILGFNLEGTLTMDGKETDILFGRENVRASVAYVKGDKGIQTPPIELICFEGNPVTRNNTDLFTTSVSEVCFATDDIHAEYRRLKELGVDFLSEPQFFDFTKDGFGKSWAVYFRDPDGIILELIEAC